MILNPYIVTYLLLSALSLLLGVVALAAGLGVARAWQARRSSEDRHRLEMRVYLSMTLVALGFFLRLVLVPLWFVMLQSLVPSIPGAMCLCGVHLLKSPASFVSTALKFLVPMAYGYWLALNTLDRRIETQPLMTRKLYALVPLALLMFAESFSDLRFLLAVKPRFVNCCSSLFDDSASPLIESMTYSGWGWVAAYFALAAGLAAMAVALLRWPHLRAAALLFVLGPVTLIAFVLAVHTRLSPLFLRAEFHHCVFCVWQKFPDMIAATAAVCIACWAAVIAAATRRVREFPGAADAADANTLALLRWIVGATLAASTLLAVRMIVTGSWASVMGH